MALREIAIGDKFDIEQINQCIRELMRLNKISVSGGLGVSNNASGIKIWLQNQDDIQLGIVVAGGDYTAADGSPDTSDSFNTGNIYYVEFGYISSDDSDAANVPMSLTKYDNTDARWRSVVATNIAEALAQTHSTPVGTWVILHKTIDLGDPPQERWWFDYTPPPIQFGKVATSYFPGNAYVELTPVKAYDDSTSTGASNVHALIYGDFNSGAPVIPPMFSAAVGDVLAYISIDPSSNDVNMLVSPPVINTGTAPYQFLGMDSAGTTAVWDYLRAH